MDAIKKGFGERLKYIRNIKNFTQEKLAESIGINLRQLARIEAGESFITSETLYKICTILDVSPSMLFDFEVNKEFLMTGSGSEVHFSVIKSGNIIQLVNKTIAEEEVRKNDRPTLDDNMQKLAQKLGKEITIDEYQDGKVVKTKIYKSNGEVEIKNLPANKLYEELKDKIAKISGDDKKLEFINLAFDSLSDKNSLEKLKLLIKGVDLLL